MTDVITYNFKKFSKIADNLCHIGNVPLYFRHVHKKTCMNCQHLFLLVAKEHTTCWYCMFVESLYDSKILKYIGLKKSPHFTILHKFSQRPPARVLNRLIFQTKRLFRQGKIPGADSSGMELDCASSNYCERIDRKEPVKGFVNLNMICDVNNKNLLVTKIRKNRISDFSGFIPMLNKIKRLDFEHFVTDKGYDSWRNHKAVQDAWGNITNQDKELWKKQV